MKIYLVMSEEDSCPGGVKTPETPQSMTTCKTPLRIRISWYNLLQLITLKAFTHVGKMVHVTQDQLRQTAPDFSCTFTHVATCSMPLPPASNKTHQCIRHLNKTLSKLWARNETSCRAFSLMNWVFVCFSSTSKFSAYPVHTPHSYHEENTPQVHDNILNQECIPVGCVPPACSA